MEQQIAHRAADTITQLLKAHLDEGAAEIDLHEAMAARDDVRELAEKLAEQGEYELPEVGDTMYDGNCPVDVVEVTDYTARLYHIENGDGPRVSEYETNADCDPQAPVVKVTYPGGDMAYPMPLDRLSRSR